MPEYLIMTESGVNPPKYIHRDISLAVAEAERLHKKYNTKTYILKVIGKVEKKEVPVTEIKSVTEIDKTELQNELPF